MKKLIFLLIPIMAFVLSYKSEAQTSTVKEELAKAQNFAKQGNTAEASKVYTGIMSSYPNNKEAVQGWLMINMKRSPTGEEEAIKQLEELEKSYPNNTGILFFKSFLQAEYNHNDEALAGFDKLITLQPDTAVNWVGKGQILDAMKRNEEALKAFEKATSLDPKRFDVWGMQADALLKLGRYDEAISTYNKAVEIAPNYAGIIYNRGCAYCRKGDKVNALADLKRAISLNPQLKVSAPKDEDFKSLWDDEDFKKLTL
ncbi:MAG: tetratricopeptide repeat protein [Bacteroidales bacterium]